MLNIELLQTNLTLLDLLFGAEKEIHLKFLRPEWTAVEGHDNSPAEQLTAAVEQRFLSDSSGRKRGVRVDISEGMFDVEDHRTERRIRGRDLEVTWTNDEFSHEPGRIAVRGQTETLLNGEFLGGLIDFEMTAPAEMAEHSHSAVRRIRLRVEQFPTDVLKPFWPRLATGSIHLSGVLTGEAECLWSGDFSETWRIEGTGDLTAESVGVEAPEWIGARRLETEHLSIGGAWDIDGNGEASERADRSDVTWRIVGDGVHLTDVSDSDPSRSLWREERLLLSGQGRFDAVQDRLELTDVSLIASDDARLSFHGTISDWSGRRQMELEGDLGADANQWPDDFRGTVFDGLRISELNARNFRIAGPLRPASSGSETAGAGTRSVDDDGELADPVVLHGSGSTENESTDIVAESGWSRILPVLSRFQIETALTWKSAEFHGLLAEAGQLRIVLADGVLHLDPVHVPVSGGEVLLAPRIDFGQPVPLLIVDDGPALRNVGFTEEMTRTWLQYIAPMLAQATSIEGDFSMHLKEGAVPIRDLSAGELGGTLTVHRARVGPGPLSRELLGIVRQIQDLLGRSARDSSAGGTGDRNVWLTMDDQPVLFQMIDGRVYHKNLVFLVSDVPVRSQGSVGLDQTLDLLIDIPIQDRWVEGRRILSAVRGEVIRIPIQGTLEKPKVDGRVIGEFAKRFGLRAAEGLLFDLLERRLNRSND